MDIPILDREVAQVTLLVHARVSIPKLLVHSNKLTLPRRKITSLYLSIYEIRGQMLRSLYTLSSKVPLQYSITKNIGCIQMGNRFTSGVGR
jgi:hypothetical protein